MAGKKIASNKAISLPVSLTAGVAASIVLTIVGAMILAVLINNETITEEGAKYGIWGVLILSSICGTQMAALCAQKRRLIVCLLSGLGYFAILLAGTALFFGGQYYGVVQTVAIIAVSAALTGFIGIKGQGRTKVRHKKYISR